MFIGFLLLFLGILVGANIYLSQRFSWYFGVNRTWMLNIVFGVLTFYMFFGLIPFANSTSLASHLIYGGAAITMGAMLYLLLSVAVVDLTRIFTAFAPQTYGLVALSLTLLVSAYGAWNASQLKITSLDVPVKGLKETTKVMHWSDIHLGHFRGKPHLNKIVEATIQQDIEAVFLTGDLFDGRIQLNKEALEPLKKLEVPVYFVEGNHDGYTGPDTIKKILREVGVIVLENQVAQFKGLQIVGLNHLLADEGKVNMHATGKGPTIKNVMDTIRLEENKPSVLLHHSPDGIQYAEKRGIDLYLSGHTHAGQIFPITLVAGLMFDYNKGLHQYKSSRIFVSQGADTFGPPMRVGTKSEITVVTLKPEN